MRCVIQPLLLSPRAVFIRSSLVIVHRGHRVFAFVFKISANSSSFTLRASGAMKQQQQQRQKKVPRSDVCVQFLHKGPSQINQEKNYPLNQIVRPFYFPTDKDNSQPSTVPLCYSWACRIFLLAMITFCRKILTPSQGLWETGKDLHSESGDVFVTCKKYLFIVIAL